jgi:hypothetical protein
MTKQVAHNIKAALVSLAALAAGYCFFGRIGIGIVLIYFIIAQVIP